MTQTKTAKLVEEATRTPLFVYGTLMPGHPNFYSYVGARALASTTPATLNGFALYKAGAVPIAQAYPRETVRGKLLYLQPEHAADVIAWVDMLEFNARYRKQKLPVTTDDGDTVIAFVYTYPTAMNLRQLPTVPEGDWEAYVLKHNIYCIGGC